MRTGRLEAFMCGIWHPRAPPLPIAKLPSGRRRALRTPQRARARRQVAGHGLGKMGGEPDARVWRRVLVVCGAATTGAGAAWVSTAPAAARHASSSHARQTRAPPIPHPIRPVCAPSSAGGAKRPAPACRKSYACADGPITAIECCATAYGCLQSISLQRLDAAAPPQNASCGACAGGGGITRVTLDGELVTGYDVDVTKWGGGGTLKRCVTAVTFKTNGGCRLRCGGAAAGAAPPPGAAAPVPASRRRLLTIPAQPATAKPPRAPSCLRRAAAPGQPASVLCALEARRCAADGSGERSLNYLRPKWAHQASQCASPPDAVRWSCSKAVLSCSAPGAPLALAGACSTNVAGAAVVYYAGQGGAAAACPAGAAASITPQLAAGPGVPAECRASEPPILVKLESRNGGSGSGGNGATRVLVGGWVLRAKVVQLCVHVCGRVARRHRRSRLDEPGPPGAAARRGRAHPSAASGSSSLVGHTHLPPPGTGGGGGGGAGCPAAPAISCDRPPLCGAPGQPVMLMGACEPEGGGAASGASLIYNVGGQLSLTATCPAPGTEVPVTVLPLFADRPACGYPTTEAFTLASEQLRRSRGGGGAGFGRDGACSLMLGPGMHAQSTHGRHRPLRSIPTHPSPLPQPLRRQLELPAAPLAPLLQPPLLRDPRHAAAAGGRLQLGQPVGYNFLPGRWGARHGRVLPAARGARGHQRQAGAVHSPGLRLRARACFQHEE